MSAQTPAHAPQQQPDAYGYAKRRQSLKVHLWLFVFTAGIGNICYAMWAKSKVAARYEW